MRYLVFGHNSNPSVDKPLHKASQARGLQLLAEGHRQVGPHHIQLLPPPDYIADQRNHIAVPVERSMVACSICGGFGFHRERKKHQEFGLERICRGCQVNRKVFRHDMAERMGQWLKEAQRA